jgi:predicted metal-dependent HD superfamily phosphohydrolase
MRAHAAELRTRWEELLGGIVATPPAARREVFDRLYAAYTGPDRHYHDIGHIADCLRELDHARAAAHDPRAIELAIWFHDVVYDGRRSDNEERSADDADAALGRLEVPAAVRQEVRRLILLTRHAPNGAPDPRDIDGQLMVDIDLTPLAAPAAVFDRNGENIRREYPHVDDAAFDRGRAGMLARFLQRPRIYCTDAFARRYEQQARDNLRRTLGRNGV